MHRSNSEALHVAGHNGTLRHTSLNGWKEATISATAIHVEVAYLDEAARTWTLSFRLSSYIDSDKVSASYGAAQAAI